MSLRVDSGIRNRGSGRPTKLDTRGQVVSARRNFALFPETRRRSLGANTKACRIKARRSFARPCLLLPVVRGDGSERWKKDDESVSDNFAVERRFFTGISIEETDLCQLLNFAEKSVVIRKSGIKIQTEGKSSSSWRDMFVKSRFELTRRYEDSVFNERIIL